MLQSSKNLLKSVNSNQLTNINKSCFKYISNDFLMGRTILLRNFSIEKQEDTIRKQDTVSTKEMEQFKQFSGEWWRPGGPYDSLRTMNELRVPMIIKLCKQNTVTSLKPLDGFKILDVGTGGGILAEPLARLGGSVIGIDPLLENIQSARYHADRDPDLNTLSYECTDVETVSEEHSNTFDVVVASEVLEHVNNPELFIRSCCNAVKPGGHIFLTTINRTLLSRVLVKYVAEYVLRIVPENTHDENKFITPYEVIDLLRKADMTNIEFKGMMLNPLTNQWSWSSSHLMNYMCHAIKPTY